ncbi:MAG TPA: arginine--tRNA ligase [Erysipelothrix sp.]
MSLFMEIETIVKESFTKAGFDGFGSISESNRPDLCQFQSNDAFSVAKSHKMNPKLVCDQVVEILKDHPAMEEVTFAPPGFINITVTDAFLLESFNKMVNDEFLGIKQVGKGKSIVMDYGGPNVAKPLHVGHVRSAVIGESVKRIAKAVGYEVIADVHLGDWGLPLGLVITELELRHPEWQCFQEGFNGKEDETIKITPELLYEVYPTASAKSKEDPAYLKKARDITAKLQDGHPGYRLLWEIIIDVSKKDIRSDYEKLDVSFDYWYGESDADAFIPGLMKTLEEKELLRESDGALVVDVVTEEDKSPMPPVIVEKSDGSSIYATTDLATIVQRQKDFNPDKIWYVVDKRQGLHFEQVFRVARKARLVDEETEFHFLGFGTMNGPDGKPFKTRDGGIMSLSSLVQMVTDSSYEKLTQTQENPSKEDALNIGTAAIKFGDLINHPVSDYVFDIDKFLSFEGKTGSYILYNNVRILAILNRLEATETYEVKKIKGEHDRNLILKLLRNPEVFLNAIENQAPNHVAEATYQIAVAFAKFYTENNISKESDQEQKESWLGLLQKTSQIISFNLDKLGIKTVEKM